MSRFSAAQRVQAAWAKAEQQQRRAVWEILNQTQRNMVDLALNGNLTPAQIAEQIGIYGGGADVNFTLLGDTLLQSDVDPGEIARSRCIVKTTLQRPLLRYHGGKWRLAPWIISHFPWHRIYTELYGGGASVLLRKPRSYAEIYNDLSGELVNLFRMVRDHGEELQRLVYLTPFAREEFDLSYEPSSDPLEQARRTLLRAMAGFAASAFTSNQNGTIERTGFRSNAKRMHTTPAHDWANYPTIIPSIVERLRGVVIENRPALELFSVHDSPETLHYCDPPYLPETRDKGDDYAHEMTIDDHREMARVLHQLEGFVVLSGYHSALYDELFADWPRVERAAMADGARPRVEVLWLSPRTWRALEQQALFLGGETREQGTKAR